MIRGKGAENKREKNQCPPQIASPYRVYTCQGDLGEKNHSENVIAPYPQIINCRPLAKKGSMGKIYSENVRRPLSTKH